MALGPHIRCFFGHHTRNRKHPSGQTGIVIAIAIVTVTEIVTATAADEVGGRVTTIGFG